MISIVFIREKWKEGERERERERESEREREGRKGKRKKEDAYKALFNSCLENRFCATVYPVHSNMHYILLLYCMVHVHGTHNYYEKQSGLWSNQPL